MSDRVDIEHALRRAMRETAAQLEPRLDAWERAAARAPSGPPVSRRWVLAMAAALVVIVVAAGVVVTRSDESPRLHTTAGAGDAVEFVPTWLPAGYNAARTESFSGLGSNGFACLDGSYAAERVSCRRIVGGVAWLARPADATQTGVVVFTRVGDDSLVLATLRETGSSRPIVVRGHPGEVIQGSEGIVVTWKERPEVRLAVVATARSADLATLQWVADGLRGSPISPDRLPLTVASAGDVSLVVRHGPANTVCVGLADKTQVGPCRYTRAVAGFARLLPSMSGEQRDVLYGMFPSTVTNARVAVRGAPPVEMAAHAVRGLPNAYFVMLLPRGTVIDRVDALDDRGRSQLTVPGPSVPDHLLSPGPGPQAYISGSPLVHGAANGHVWQLRAESLGDVVCTQIDVDGRREPEHCWPAIDLMQFTDDAEFIVGIVGPDVARVVVQPLDSPPASTTLVRDKGIPLTLFVAPRPTGARGYDVTAFDKAGRVVGGGSVRSSSSSSGGSSSGSSSPG